MSTPTIQFTAPFDLSQRGTDPLLTVREVALWLRVDATTVRRWIKNEILEAIELPHSGKRRGYRIKVSQLKAAISLISDNTATETR